MDPFLSATVVSSSPLGALDGSDEILALETLGCNVGSSEGLDDGDSDGFSDLLALGCRDDGDSDGFSDKT